MNNQTKNFSNKISIIIPAYNEEKNLPRVINSLRVQDPKNFEIIVVDNNSTDNTFKVAKNLADKVYKCKKQGISYARNYGAKKAKTEIIAFLDADSLAYPNWVNLVSEAFKDKKLTLISGVGVYENNSLIRRIILNIFSYIIFYCGKIQNWFGIPTLIANNMAIRKKLFEKVGGFDHYVVEDYYLSLKLRKIKNIRTIMDSKMKVEYSSRRIDKIGIIASWKVWLLAILKKIPSEEYTLQMDCRKLVAI